MLELNTFFSSEIVFNQKVNTVLTMDDILTNLHFNGIEF